MPTTTAHPTDNAAPAGADATREQAVRRVRNRHDFNAHVFAYVLVNIAVWAIWIVIALNAGAWWPWPLFVTLGWGVGLAFHGWDAYLRAPITEDEVRAEIERLTRQA